VGFLSFFDMPLVISEEVFRGLLEGKSVCMDGRGHDPMSFKRNLQSLAVLLLILSRSACLFLGQTGGQGATLYRETFYSPNFENDACYNYK